MPSMAVTGCTNMATLLCFTLGKEFFTLPTLFMLWIVNWQNEKSNAIFNNGV